MVTLGAAHSAALVVDPKQLRLSQTETAPQMSRRPAAPDVKQMAEKPRGRTCSTEHGAASLDHPGTERRGWGLTRGLWLHVL